MFLPAAVLLGALHGLEPGHSKTIMAAFIVAIRGTVKQALLLGLAATVSHTAIIWVLAFIGLHYAGKFDVERLEVHFQIATGLLVIALALWMLWRTRRQQRKAEPHDHDHDHDHDHGHDRGHDHDHDHDHAHHVHTHEHEHDEYEDAHEKEHAEQLARHFADRQVTTWQIVLFGLTGGLLPCPSAFAVLLVCLQLKQFTLGFAVVLAFSLGLALTLVSVGTVAALSVREAGKRLKGFDTFARKAPYASSILLIAVGLIVLIQGLRQIVW